MTVGDTSSSRIGNEGMRLYVHTFIVVQAATVVGMSTILFGLLRFF